MTLKDLYNSLFSAALASAILFGVGYHPTVDAIILTLVWIVIVLAILSVILLSVVTFVVRHNEEIRSAKEMAPFYKAISNMHKEWAARILSYGLTLYWLYALIVQEWTATAVVYTISSISAFTFIQLTRDLEKEYFVERLKGESAK